MLEEGERAMSSKRVICVGCGWIGDHAETRTSHGVFCPVCEMPPGDRAPIWRCQCGREVSLAEVDADDELVCGCGSEFVPRFPTAQELMSFAGAWQDDPWTPLNASVSCIVRAVIQERER
jgi:hypothetical protein